MVIFICTTGVCLSLDVVRAFDASRVVLVAWRCGPAVVRFAETTSRLETEVERRAVKEAARQAGAEAQGLQARTRSARICC